MKRQYYNNFSFLDLLFNFLLAVTILLIIAVLNIVTQQNEADIKTKAEYVITVVWDDEKNNDVDIWIRDPHNELLWYRDQHKTIMHADRDDTGHNNDQYDDGRFIRVNQEIVTIRGIREGDWIINLHYYRIGDSVKDKKGTNVEISFIKLNPKAKPIFTKKYFMKDYWDQVTVARFYMTETGEILNLTDSPPIDLIEDRVKPNFTTPQADYDYSSGAP